nr:cyclase family protein [uncultured Psychroserpens sp.]
MTEIIDLTQDIYEGMPVYKDLPQVKMSVHNTHEEWDGDIEATTRTPAVHKLELGEHTGTHVDAINHMAKKHKGESIDKMPLSQFYTEGICLDLSHKGFEELIDVDDIIAACKKQNLDIREKDTVLLYTNHYRNAFRTDNWDRGPGITTDAARWLGNQKISAFGVETMSPGVPGVSNKEVHHICGELGFTHYENMINLYKLVSRGRFRFIAFPLKIKGGTGSPVRAVAIFEN